VRLNRAKVGIGTLVRQPHIAAQQAIGPILPRSTMELWQSNAGLP
jgi:hypothetical protein